MGKRITKSIALKIDMFLKEYDEVNWVIALQLLKSINGLNSRNAEIWFQNRIDKIHFHMSYDTSLSIMDFGAKHIRNKKVKRLFYFNTCSRFFHGFEERRLSRLKNKYKSI